MNGTFSLFNRSRFGKNTIIFGVKMGPFVDIGIRKKHILVLGKGSAQKSGYTTLTAEK